MRFFDVIFTLYSKKNLSAFSFLLYKTTIQTHLQAIILYVIYYKYIITGKFILPHYLFWGRGRSICIIKVKQGEYSQNYADYFHKVYITLHNIRKFALIIFFSVMRAWVAPTWLMYISTGKKGGADPQNTNCMASGLAINNKWCYIVPKHVYFSPFLPLSPKKKFSFFSFCHCSCCFMDELFFYILCRRLRILINIIKIDSLSIILDQWMFVDFLIILN